MQAFLYQRLAFLLTSRFAEFRFMRDSMAILEAVNLKEVRVKDARISRSG